ESPVWTELNVDRAGGAGHEVCRIGGEVVARGRHRRPVDLARDVVGEEVVAPERAEADRRKVATDDRRAERTGPGAGIVENRSDVTRLCAAGGKRALAIRPRVVPARLDDVELLARALADVPDPRLAGDRLEPEAKRIPEAVSVYLGTGAG